MLTHALIHAHLCPLTIQYKRAMASGRVDRANEKEVELKELTLASHSSLVDIRMLVVHESTATRCANENVFVSSCHICHAATHFNNIKCARTLPLSFSIQYSFSSCSQLREPVAFASAKFMTKLTGMRVVR